MALHNQVGKDGEQLALGYLKKNGFEILHCNWRYSRYEIDIIARKNGRLHFVEVKARKFFPGSHPEENVSKKKFMFLKNAAEEYLHLHPGYSRVQFDVLAITLYRNREPEYFLIEDVFL